MNLKSFYILSLLMFITYEVKPQLYTNQNHQNLLYFEVGGLGGYESLNYERVMPIKANLKLGLRLGASTYKLADYTNKFNPDFAIPIAISGLYGKTHKVEFGFGQILSSIIQASHSNWLPERKTNLHANLTLGYRYQKDEGGLVFRCCYTPTLEFYKFYRHWASVSIGYAFKLKT